MQEADDEHNKSRESDVKEYRAKSTEVEKKTGKSKKNKSMCFFLMKNEKPNYKNIQLCVQVFVYVYI